MNSKITGGPSAGKTTVINELAARSYTIVPDAARDEKERLDRISASSDWNKELSFKCLGCGDGLKTHKETHFSRGMCGAGDSEYEVLVYSGQDAYFLRLENPLAFENTYRTPLHRLLENKTSAIKSKVEQAVSDEEFRKLVLNEKLAELGQQNHSKNIILSGLEELIGREFDDRSISEYGLAIHAHCADLILRAASNINEKKYVTEDGNKKFLRVDATIDAIVASKLLAYVFNQISGKIAQADFSNSEKLVFELAHFSEYVQD